MVDEKIPIVQKFKTKNGYYIYDINSNNIVKVDKDESVNEYGKIIKIFWTQNERVFSQPLILPQLKLLIHLTGWYMIWITGFKS